MRLDQTIRWPKLFTCPAGAKESLAKDDLGETIFNPMFSNRQKMIESPDGCDGCDYREAGECAGPVEYTLAVASRMCIYCKEMFQPEGGERKCPSCREAQAD